LLNIEKPWPSQDVHGFLFKARVIMVERSFDRRLRVVTVLTAGLVLANGWLSYHHLKKLYAETEEVARRHKAIEALQAVPSLLAGAESAQRGYLLTGDTSHLGLYKVAAPAISEQIKQFSHLTADAAIQQKRIPALKAAVNKRLKILHDNLSLATKKGSKFKRKALNKGKAQMDLVRTQIRQMIETETQLVMKSSANAQRIYHVFVMTCFAVNLACLAAVGSIFAFRHYSRPSHA
jgi:CHASE3 domain sensor protein